MQGTCNLGSWNPVEEARPIMSSASPFRGGLDAGRLESSASASSLTDRQCIVLSSGRLACFAGPWVCLKEAPQPAFTLPPSCYLTLSTFTTALLTHGVFTNKTLSLYHDTSPTAPLSKTPLQPPSSQYTVHPPEHTTPLPTATGFISAISTSTATPASSLHRTATHQHCNHDAPLRLHLQRQLHGL
jgi:hypothetical protein